MQSTFWSGTGVTILWSWWHPTSLSAYVLSMFAVGALSFSRRALTKAENIRAMAGALRVRPKSPPSALALGRDDTKRQQVVTGIGQVMLHVLSVLVTYLVSG